MFPQQLTLCSSTQTVDETFPSVLIMMSTVKPFIDFLSILKNHNLNLRASCQGLRNSSDTNKRVCHFKEFYLVFRILFTLNVICMYMAINLRKFITSESILSVSI